MKKSVEPILSKCNDLLWARGISIKDTAELFFAFIAWKFVSDQVSFLTSKIDAPTDWVDPGADFHFDNFRRTHNWQSLYNAFENVLLEWERKNPQLAIYLLPSSGVSLQQVDDHVLITIYSLWKDYFNHMDIKYRWTKDSISTLFDSIESFLIKHYTSAYLFFTPKSVVDLMAKVTSSYDNGVVYDPFFRSSTMFSAVAENFPNATRVAGEVRESVIWRMIKVQSLLLGIPSDDIVLTKTLDELPKRNTKFDVIITNPPFGGPSNTYEGDGYWTWIFSKINRQEASALGYVLDHLNSSGKATVIVPSGVLNQELFTKLREVIVQHNFLEAAILLPPKLFYQTTASTAMLCFNKVKPTKDVLLVDASSMGTKDNDRHRMHKEDIDKVIHELELYRAGEKHSFDETSVVVTPNELAEHNYDLRLFTYRRGANFPSFSYISSQTLWKECLSLEAQLVKVQEKIQSIYNKL